MKGFLGRLFSVWFYWTFSKATSPNVKIYVVTFLAYFQQFHTETHASRTWRNYEPLQTSKATKGCLTCLSLTRRGPNTIHWISLATNIRKQQAVFTSTWKERKQSATNTFALFRKRGRGGQRMSLTKPTIVHRIVLVAFFFFWWNLSLASSKTCTVAVKSLNFFL